MDCKPFSALGLLFFFTLSVSAQTAPARQTEFNDNNYRPRGALNSTPVTKRPQSNNKAHHNSRIEPRQSVNWKREGNGGTPEIRRKNSTRGTFYYQIRNGRINTSELCSNYPSGTFVYRDCRLEAKRYFTARCASSFPAACGAAGMAP